MTMPKYKMSRWCSEVHAHYLGLGTEFTAREAALLFGESFSSTGPQNGLDNAAADGHFTRRVTVEDGKRVYRYRAAIASAKDHQVPTPSNKSWFTGLKRVRSVFELGEHL